MGDLLVHIDKRFKMARKRVNEVYDRKKESANSTEKLAEFKRNLEYTLKTQ